MIISKNLFAKVSLFVFSTFIAGLFLTSVCFGQLPGELDPTFFAGRTTTNIATGDDGAYATAIQADGKIVVVGSGGENNWAEYAVARYNTDGTLDKSFSGDGKAAAFVGDSGIAYAVAIQTDGKIVVAGDWSGGSFLDFAVARFNSDGSLDSSFSGDGMATMPIGSEHDTAYSVVIQPDGKIALAGQSFGGAATIFALARFNPNGSPDTGFDGDGKLTTSFGNSSTATSIAYYDGRLIVAGFTGNSSHHEMAVARYNMNGSLDTSFDADGKTTAGIGTYSGVGILQNICKSVKIQADGKIVVAGLTDYYSNFDFALIRFNGNGSLDNTFDGDGKVVTSIGTSHDVAEAITIQPDGKILAAGYTVSGNDVTSIAVTRYNPNGSLDASFDNDGIASISVGLPAYANTIALQTDGKIVIAGITHNNNDTNYDFAVARLNANGSLDGAFGNRVFTNFGSENAQANSTAVQPDGKIVVAGYGSNGSNRDFAVSRYNSDGTLDFTFGTNGKVMTAFSTGNDEAQAVAIQPDGKIVVAGYSQFPQTISFAIARFNTDGTLDNTFGNGNGKMATGVGSGSGNSLAYAMAIQPNGRIVVVGTVVEGNSEFAMVRYGPTGSLDSGFGNGGRVVTPIGANSDTARGVAIQTDGKIIVAGEASNGGLNIDFALARYNADGSLDTNFDNDGKALTEMGSLNERIRSVAIQSDNKIVAAGYGLFSNFNILVARYNANGSLDTSFDGDGRVVTDLAAGQDDYANAALIQSDGKIVVGGSTNTGSQTTSDAAFARYNTDGSLDAGFDFSALETTADQMNPNSLNFAGDGKVVIPIGSGDDQILDIALQPNGKIVAVGSAFNGAEIDFAMIRLNGTPIAPTASVATISGRVTMGKGRAAAVNRAVVSITDSAGNTRTTLTDAFGYYRFEAVEAGQTYVLNAASKRYQFAAQVVLVNENIENLDFTDDSVFPN